MNRPERKHTDEGFALVIALLMMVLLVVVSVGLLTLSSISLRTTSREQAGKTAEANARFALMVALGELQKTLGDDRRVTANASILQTGAQAIANPQMVGVWESATSTLRAQPTAGGSIDYDSWKSQRFKSWLVSSTDPEATKSMGFAKAPSAGAGVPLFNLLNDGFKLEAGKVAIAKAGASGQSSMAWAVIQEADKAHISQPGEIYQETNDVLQAPMHPNLALSKIATQPTGGWNARAAKLISLNQAALDPDYKIAKESVGALSNDYTVWSRGVLADVANGGLKVDLNLSFELSDTAFAKAKWDGTPNPFRIGTGTGEVILHGHISDGEPISTELKYDGIKNQQRYPVGAAPTFDMLRSSYTAYKHLYLSGGTTTAFERPQVNKAWTKRMGAIYPATRGSETSLSPVLDRMAYVMSLWGDSVGTPWLVFTPVVTLWNPYNVAIESEGYVAYPWMDIPMWLDFTIKSGGNVKEQKGSYMSWLIGADKSNTKQGRQIEPYFYCTITGDGTGATTTPVRLEPGEIRVFVPTETKPRFYDRKSAPSARVWRMKPVQTLNDLKLGGGVGIDTTKGMYAGPATKMAAGDTLQCRFDFQPNSYHYFTTLEDSAKIKNIANKGAIVNEVQLFQGSPNSQFTSTDYTHYPGMAPKIVGVLETYHQTAMQTGGQSDIVQAVNTRQRYVNSAVSGSKFLAGPNYNSSMRPGSDLTGLGMQTTTDGKRAFYGATNDASSRDKIVLFDVPRQPLISLASFQNADLADTVFSTSNQFANSWASPHLSRTSVGRVAMTTETKTDGVPDKIGPKGLGIYDHSWLLNDALWDTYFLSSIAPQVSQKSAAGSADVYNKTTVTETRKIKEIVDEWVDDAAAHPLKNSHMTFHSGGVPKEEIKTRLNGEAGGLRAAEHLMVEGSFNVNSTNEGAWRAILASLRGESFNTLATSGSLKLVKSGTKTPAPRLSMPYGEPGDLWSGFRELTDAQIEALAREIVVEVKARGPFQSLAEFVNRRVAGGDLGLKGALQAAIDRSGLNDQMKLSTFDNTKFYAKENLPDPQTGTGLAGWLTQADILGPMASIITVRSDTFRIRGYGEVKNQAGQVIASATCEAVVQRLPEWVDPADKAGVKPDKLTSAANKAFGRRFEVVSFRMLSSRELTAS